MISGKRVLFVNDTSEECHWGSFATSSRIKLEILKAGPSKLEILSTFDIAAASNLPKDSSELELSFANFAANNKTICDKIKNSDFVVINGEGTIHGFSPRALTLLYIMHIAKKQYGRRVFVINHSCFLEQDSPRVRQFYRACYECCDYVAVRERASFDTLEGLGVKSTLAFDSMPLTIREMSGKRGPIFKKGRRTICLSGGVNFRKSKTRMIAFWLKLLFPKHDFIFLLGGLNPENPNDKFDETIALEIGKRFRNLRIIRAESLEEWLGCIKSAEILVTGRFHYAVTRMAFGGPMVAFESNTPKTSEVLETASCKVQWLR